jgi:sigma-B regulation protein RsbU (phosphoserine phosphatase)
MSKLGLQVAAEPEQLKVVRAYLHDELQPLLADEKTTFRLVLAVDEACQNIIRHAFSNTQGALLILLSHTKICLTINLYDNGDADLLTPLAPVKPLPESADTMSPGGLGLHIIDQVFDEWGFVTSDNVNFCHQMQLIYHKVDPK